MNKEEKLKKDLLAAGLVLLVECKCTRMVNGQLQTICCYLKEDKARACMKKTDLEFEKSWKED